jgi:hypothetical protein
VADTGKLSEFAYSAGVPSPPMTGMPAPVRVPISLFSPSGAVMPTTASTCCEMRYSAHEWAALASYFESHHTYCTWRPLMPPAALTPCM